ncbi:hypothetical protein AVEN_128760-1, partial [Araneus ventricosus]
IPKGKRGVAGDAARRQQAIMKSERRVAATDEERNRLWRKVARTEETEEQNDSLLTVMAQHGQRRRAEGNRRTKEWPISHKPPCEKCA